MHRSDARFRDMHQSDARFCDMHRSDARFHRKHQKSLVQLSKLRVLPPLFQPTLSLLWWRFPAQNTPPNQRTGGYIMRLSRLLLSIVRCLLLCFCALSFSSVLYAQTSRPRTIPPKKAANRTVGGLPAPCGSRVGRIRNQTETPDARRNSRMDGFSVTRRASGVAVSST